MTLPSCFLAGQGLKEKYQAQIKCKNPPAPFINATLHVKIQCQELGNIRKYSQINLNRILNKDTFGKMKRGEIKHNVVKGRENNLTQRGSDQNFNS